MQPLSDPTPTNTSLQVLNTAFTSLDDDALLTSTQTRARVGGVSNMCIWRWMRDDRVGFPRPVQINGRNYWRLGDLRAWQAKQTSAPVFMAYGCRRGGKGNLAALIAEQIAA